MEIKMQLAF